MLVFRLKRAPPGPTQVPCPVPLAALRTPPDHTRCIGTTYAGRRRRTDGGRERRTAASARADKDTRSPEAPRWIDQGNGCDTRKLVLIRDGSNVKVGQRCRIV